MPSGVLYSFGTVTPPLSVVAIFLLVFFDPTIRVVGYSSQDLL